MAKISINLDVPSQLVVLEGDVQLLIRDRFAWRYLKDYFQPIIESSCIKIPIGNKELYTILSDVSAMLRKYKIDEIRSENSEKVIIDYYLEEEKFAEFSNAALQIRNNNCNAEEFKLFTDVIARALTARSLYPLQLLSAYHMAFAQNSCNFSVPGAGKTSIVYGAYAYLKNLPDDDFKKVDRLLIIGPLSSFGPWEIEYSECFGKKPSVKRLISGISRDEKNNYLYSKHPSEITLISYSSLVSLKEEIIYFLKYNRVMVVADEAHKAKNTSGGIVAQSILEISKYCSARAVLTGTPAPNGYEDLYNLFKFIWPMKNVIGFEVNQLKDMTLRHNDARVERLVDNIAPFFIRIRKSDLHIPAATNHPPIEVSMGAIQRRIYDYIERRYVDELIESNALDMTSRFKQMLIQAKLLRLMQAATNPTMLKIPLSELLDMDDDIPKEAYQAINDTEVLKEIMNYDAMETPSKFVCAKELVESIISRGEKVVVWATFINTILEFKAYLSKFNIASQELYGAIPVEKDEVSEESNEMVLTRERIIKEFHKHDCPYKVLIANPFAVAESISLHKACHNAIYIERSFNAAHFVQSKDRIHRYGLNTHDKTNYYYIISKDSIDETIDARLIEKERRMIEIMEALPIPLFDNAFVELGDEDIKAIIRDYARRNK